MSSKTNSRLSILSLHIFTSLPRLHVLTSFCPSPALQPSSAFPQPSPSGGGCWPSPQSSGSGCKEAGCGVRITAGPYDTGERETGQGADVRGNMVIHRQHQVITIKSNPHLYPSPDSPVLSLSVGDSPFTQLLRQQPSEPSLIPLLLVYRPTSSPASPVGHISKIDCEFSHICHTSVVQTTAASLSSFIEFIGVTLVNRNTVIAGFRCTLPQHILYTLLCVQPPQVRSSSIIMHHPHLKQKLFQKIKRGESKLSS